jgi:hypothetical protein
VQGSTASRPQAASWRSGSSNQKRSVKGIAMYLPDVSLALFSLFNTLRLGSYIPQIIRVAADREGAKAISYSTWCIWIGANASTAIYAVVNVMDTALFYVSALNTVGCTAVVGLTAFKRHRFRQSHRRCVPTHSRQRQTARSRRTAASCARAAS